VVGPLNYAGTSDDARFPDGLGADAHGPAGKSVHLDAPPAHAPSDAIIVPDAHFLFNSDFKRSGADLILSADGHELVLHDYFKGEKHAPLASPDGAHLTGDLVNALTGSVDVSQAGGAAVAGKVIGHVTKLQGTATATRNGVSIILHQGDDVEKGDVVQSGSDSTLGISFVDGTVFGLSSNARMVLNEMVYAPNGSNNSSLISLVSGTISFVAGETAKHGDMKVDTPVATMGIRGTAVLVEIDFSVPGQGGTPSAKFQVLVEPDGTTGSYVLLDKATLQPLATVNQAGHQINISNGAISETSESLSPEIQKLITDVFSLKFTDNTNPKSTTHFTDIGVLETTPLKFANTDLTVLATYVVSNPPSETPELFAHGVPVEPGFLPHIPVPPSAVVLDIFSTPTTQFALSERIGKTGDAVDVDIALGKVSYADANAADQPSVSVSFKSFAYQNAQHADVSGSLNALQLQDVAAVEANIVVVQDPAHKNFGTANWSYNVPDKAFDFLAEGETLTLTYIVRVDSNLNEHTEIPITITVTGTNDAPVITTSAQSIAFSDDTGGLGGSLTAHDPTAGSLSFADADLSDTHTVSSKLSGATLQGGGAVPSDALALFEQAFSATLAADSTGTGNGAINWSLANLPADVADFIPAGQTLTLTYIVMVTDSHGASSEQSVTVTITGTDNPAEIWIATGSGATGTNGARIESLAASVLLWSDGANWKTGHAPTAQDDVIILTDPSHGLTPAFPVTIDHAAFAKSVTMDDLGGGNTPELDNLSTLTVSGAFTAHADAVVHNAGTISVGGHAELLDQSVLVNSGTLLLSDGGDFGAHAGIGNSGIIELVGGTLTVSADVVNADGCHQGAILIDAGAKLVLAAGGIEDGGVAVAGRLELDGGAFLSHGLLANFGTITVSGGANAFHGETVIANHVLEIMTDSALALDHGTCFDNYCGTITVDDGATLSLDHASIAGGWLHNSGEIDVVGSSTLDGSALDGGAIIIGPPGHSGGLFMTVAMTESKWHPVTFTLDHGATITDADLTIGFSGRLEIGDFGATLSGVHVDNSGAVVVDSCAILDLAATDISGAGSFHVDGTVESTGASSIGGTVINDGSIEVKSGTLDISGCVTGCGAITIDVGATLELGGADAQLVKFDGCGSSELVLDASGSVREIQGFGVSDELDLRAINFDDDPTASYDKKSHILTVRDSDGDIVRAKLTGDDYSNAHFAASDDGHGGTLITLEACDAAPVIAACDQQQSGTINERAGTTGSFKMDSADGTIHFTDVDLTDRPTARISEQSVTWTDANGDCLALTLGQMATLEHALKLSQFGNTNNGAIDWTYAIADRDLDFLGAGQILTITAVVSIDDHQGGKTDVPVTVTINGAEDAPFMVGETNPSVQTVILSKPPIVHTTGLSTETFDHQPPSPAPNNDQVKLSHAMAGTLTVTDKDVGDTLTASVTGDAAIKYNGSSHLPANFDVDALIDSTAIKFDSVTSDGKADVLHWSYDPSNADLDFLKPGDTLTITYQAQVSDGHGSFGEQPLTITINGNGSSVVNGTAQNDTFDNVGGGVTIFGKGGNDTFVFTPHFGSATIADFDVNRDTLELDHSLFGSTAHDVLNGAHAANAGHDTVLIDAAHDTITLKGVTLAQLMAHQNDFHIV
jgi:fibronectin-binding autotransporter adhesin